VYSGSTHVSKIECVYSCSTRVSKMECVYSGSTRVSKIECVYSGSTRVSKIEFTHFLCMVALSYKIYFSEGLPFLQVEFRC
jgi:hypothetical protein